MRHYSLTVSNQAPGEACLLSVIIATKDDAERLAKTISSLNEQVVEALDMEDIEFLIINGGAPLESKKDGLASKYRMRIVNSRDRGIYDAMNRGIAKAMGSWIYFLNCGDVLATNRCLRQVAASLRSESLSRVGLVSMRYRREGRVEENAYAGSWLWRYFLTYGVLCHQSIVFKTDLLKEQGGYDTSYKYVADKKSVMQALRRNIRVKKSDIVIVDWEADGVCSKNQEEYDREVVKLRLEDTGGSLKRRIVGLAMLYTHVIRRRLCER